MYVCQSVSDSLSFPASASVRLPVICLRSCKDKRADRAGLSSHAKVIMKSDDNARIRIMRSSPHDRELEKEKV